MVTELTDARLAYNYVRKKILNGSCIAGTRLTSRDLPGKVTRLRAPGRHALRQLEAEGLVALQPRLGAVVRPLDSQEFRDLCGTRQALEIYAAGLAAQNRTDAQLEELRRPLLAMRRILDGIRDISIAQTRLDELVREDINFHLCIIGISGNQLLKREVMRLHLIHRVTATALKSKPIHTLVERRRVQSDHEQIFDAIARGDSAAARDNMERHLQGNPLRFRP